MDDMEALDEAIVEGWGLAKDQLDQLKTLAGTLAKKVT